ncbi:FMO5 [Cordylochernes scorpioides]|uniref:Flavin-containing monooxygenase n=1 Tax=Cordylochernes scorpioides TaxID=51811 RepID=A0ABY6KM52_9ARAC|nr:FMO5 [Cordylochernes scorpioides]
MGPTRRVCIVGFGYGGIGCVRECLKEGLKPCCFEIQDGMCGLWRYKENNIEGCGSVMNCTRVLASKEFSTCSDILLSDNLPIYLHHSQVYKETVQHVEKMGLNKYVKFQHRVESVRKADDYQETGRWKVTVKDLQSEKVTEDIFDAVMICTGHHAYPNEPKFPDQEKFQGRVIHSLGYKTNAGYEGKRVVVVGGGNSAIDSAVDVSHVAKTISISNILGVICKFANFTRNKRPTEDTEIDFGFRR